MFVCAYRSKDNVCIHVYSTDLYMYTYLVYMVLADSTNMHNDD